MLGVFLLLLLFQAIVTLPTTVTKGSNVQCSIIVTSINLVNTQLIDLCVMSKENRRAN